jgi:hypothetical protein
MTNRVDDLLTRYEALPDGSHKAALRGLVANLRRTKDPAVVEYIAVRILQVVDGWRSNDPLTRFHDGVAALRRAAKRRR